MQMLETIVDSLYASDPPELLYHFTSTDALLKIVPEAGLWATDVHYLDAVSELRRAFALFDEEAQVLHAHTDFKSPVLDQLSQWLKDQIHKPRGIYVACFSASGNSLSHWRGCTSEGKGASLGFLGEQLWESCLTQKFWIGRCIYDVSRQRSISRQIVQTMFLEASAIGPDRNASPTQSFFGRFDAAAAQLLQVASLFKSAALETEDEWRAISYTALANADDNVEFRAGALGLVPYVNIALPKNARGGVDLESVTVGPTPQNHLSLAALANFLFKHDSSPGMGVSDCGIPHRRQ